MVLLRLDSEAKVPDGADTGEAESGADLVML